jgi:hypothetical protein
MVTLDQHGVRRVAPLAVLEADIVRNVEAKTDGPYRGLRGGLHGLVRHFRLCSAVVNPHLRRYFEPKRPGA